MTVTLNLIVARIEKCLVFNDTAKRIEVKNLDTTKVLEKICEASLSNLEVSERNLELAKALRETLKELHRTQNIMVVAAGIMFLSILVNLIR